MRGSPIKSTSQTVVAILLFVKILHANVEFEPLCSRRKALLLLFLSLILVVQLVTTRISSRPLYGSLKTITVGITGSGETLNRGGIPVFLYVMSKEGRSARSRSLR